MEKYLEIEIIWKDEHLIELGITATNGIFSGITKVYDSSETLMLFADSLINYPKENNTIFYSAGEPNGYSFFSIEIYYTQGNVYATIALESNYLNKKGVKDKVSLELLTELNLIDNFQRHLKTLAKYEEGKATLIGI